MGSILISEFQVPNCQFFGTTAKLRLYCDDDWTDSLGVRHLSGSVRSINSFYQEIACTLANDVLSVPAFTTYSTVDALQNANVRISAEIFDQAGAWRKTLFDGWFIPTAPTTTTRNAIEIANQGQHLVWPPNWYLNAVGVQQLIDAVIGLLRFATTVIAGWVRLSWPALDATDPIAVSDTDPRVALLTALRATGTATLVPATSTTIATSLVTASSEVDFRARGEGIQGNLHVINIVPGVSFDVYSSEGGDAGDFRWLLY